MGGLENAPSQTGNPSGGGRGNNPPGKWIHMLYMKNHT